VAPQGLRRPVPAGPVHQGQAGARRRLRAHAAPPVRRGRLPGVGVRRLDHRHRPHRPGCRPGPSGGCCSAPRRRRPSCCWSSR
jgi:hypothetical protein